MWEALRDPLEWPGWWDGCRSVRQLDPGDEHRVGARYASEWRGRVPLPVRFEFEVEEVAAPRLMRGRASGAVIGSGTWRLTADGPGTALTYEWEVSLTRAWMRLVPRSVLVRNHDWVMERGREGLTRRLRDG